MPAGRVYQVVFRLGLAVLGALLLAGCNEDLTGASGYRAYAPIPDDTLNLITSKGSSRTAPILIRAYKKEAEFEIWKLKDDGHYVHLKTFPMCRWSGQLGPKVREGDRQVPEGFYTIMPGSMNPNSAYYLSFNVGYPNAYDRAWGHTGGSIMVHGICSSAGCFSMTDKQIEEIYAITREAFAGGQRAIQMESFPFRMTAENLAKYRLDPNISFWRELKHGSDYFEATKTEPPVGVCAKRYVFGTPKNGQRFDAESACPPLAEQPEIASAISEKAAKDEAEIASLIAKGVKPIRTVYADGGQNPAFSGRIYEMSRPDAVVAGPTEIALDEPSKSKPVSVQVASAKAAAAARAMAAAVKTAPPNTTIVAAAKPETTGTVSATGPVAATFAAAPVAYAKEEPQSKTRAFFDKVITFGFGGSAPDETPPPAPAAAAATPDPAKPAAAVPLPPQRQAGAGPLSPHAALPKPIGIAPGIVDPNVLAYAQDKD